MGENAYEEVKANWNVEKVSKKYLDVLKEVDKQKFVDTYTPLKVNENIDETVGYA